MRNNNQKRRNAIIAAALGAALLMGGGTFAVWTASAGIFSGSIIAGELALMDSGASTVYDMSPDSTLTTTKTAVYYNGTANEEGRPISNIGFFRASPGDEIAFKNNYVLAVRGTNLVADLQLDISKLVTSPDGTKEPLFDLTQWTFSWAFSTDSYPAPGPLQVISDPTVPVTVQSGLTEAAGDDMSIYLVLVVKFNYDAEGDMNVGLEVADMSDLVSMKLVQDRVRSTP